MKGKLLLFILCFTLAGPAAFGQGQAQLPKLHLQMSHRFPNQKQNAALANSAAKPPSLPLFTYNVHSSRDGNDYSGTIVGRSPFNHGSGQVSVAVQVIPVVIMTNAISTAISPDGIVSTAPGATTFDPRVANSCLAAPNSIPLTVALQSPIFNPADFNFGGTDVGTTQYVDAFQRANFWEVINRSSYHVRLGPVRTLSPIVINVPADNGFALTTDITGACGPLGIIDANLFDGLLQGTIIPALSAQGVNPSTLPIFLLSNVALSAVPTDLAHDCCIGGYHNVTGDQNQTYSPALFDSTGLFGLNAMDSATLSHEVGEWMNDPFGGNPTPAWGHTGQVAFCQNNLEVGDPLSGTDNPLIAMPNGFNYHLQELAFFSWFYGAPSIGIHHWFSNDGTFLQDAGPPCVN